MRVSKRHILRQGPVIAALARAATVALRQKPDQAAPLQTPTPMLQKTVKPRHPDLIKDYIRAVGGSTSWYKGVVPAHLFPQWGFPLFARTLEGIPYDMRRVLNGGCRMEFNKPIPANESMVLEACLANVDDNGRRAVLQQRITTSTKSAPDALVATLYAIVPLKRDKTEAGAKKKKTDRARVPIDARELGRWKLTPETAWAFAVLTGDFNPIHWVKPAARAAGFKSTILHGFATLALTIETLNRVRFSGDVSRLHTIDVKFTRPLVLPAKVGLYLHGDNELAVGDAPGGPAYLTGTFTTRQENGHE